MRRHITTGPNTPFDTLIHQILPHVSIGDVTGLIELVYTHGGREDLYQIGRSLHLEIDYLFPLIEAADVLDFAEAGVLEEKKVFSEQALTNIRILRRIVDELQKTPSHILPEEHFVHILEEHFDEKEAGSQLETAINWGRYAELFSYQEERGIFRLEEAEATTTS